MCICDFKLIKEVKDQEYNTWPRAPYGKAIKTHINITEVVSPIPTGDPKQVAYLLFQDINLKFQSKFEILSSQTEKTSHESVFLRYATEISRY